MVEHSAILFDFPDARSASDAFDILGELGFDPVLHAADRVHIHVDGGDLTSALEIVQSYGGKLVDQSAITEDAITNSAYALNAITIPAHIVNEDMVEGESFQNREEVDTRHNDEFASDDEQYSHFSGDVHI